MKTWKWLITVTVLVLLGVVIYVVVGNQNLKSNAQSLQGRSWIEKTFGK